MTVNDQRAISIAIATNLLRRQDLTIIERGKAYKALLDARNRHGFRTDLTSGESRQKYSARGIVAEFFGVTEYEIRKAVKLAQLIPPLAEIVENEPKKLNLVCADLIADYVPDRRLRTEQTDNGVYSGAMPAAISGPTGNLRHMAGGTGKGNVAGCRAAEKAEL